MGDWIQLGEYASARLFDDGVLHIRDDSHGFVALARHEVARLLALLERKAGEADDELWRAMRIVARATPSLYIPAELLELCRTPDEFIRHASRVAGLNGRQPDGKPDPAPVASGCKARCGCGHSDAEHVDSPACNDSCVHTPRMPCDCPIHEP